METRVLLTGLSSIVFVLIDSERRVRSAVSFLLIFFYFFIFYSVTLHSLFKKERKKNSHVSVATHLFKRTCPKLLLEGVNNSGYELMKYVNITRLPSGRRREREIKRERDAFLFFIVTLNAGFTSPPSCQCERPLVHFLSALLDSTFTGWWGVVKKNN